jgi:WD40 repeat protein
MQNYYYEGYSVTRYFRIFPRNLTVCIWSVLGLSLPVFAGHSSVLRKELEGAFSISLDEAAIGGTSDLEVVHKLTDRSDESRLTFITAMEFLPSGDLLVAKWHGEIVLWDTDTGREKWRRNLIDKRLGQFDISRSGEMAIFGGNDSKIYLLNMGNGGTIRTFEVANNDAIRFLKFNRDEDGFAAGDINGRISHYTLDNEVPEIVFSAHEWPIRAFHYSGADNYVFSADSYGIKLWTADNQLLRDIPNPFGDRSEIWYSSLSFSKEMDIVVAGGYQQVALIDLSTGLTERIYGNHPMGVVVAKFAKNDTEVMSVSRNMRLKRYDADTGEELFDTRIPGAFMSTMTGFTENADGTRMAVAAYEADIFSRKSFPAIRILRYK